MTGLTLIGWISFTHPQWILSVGMLTFLAGYFILLICLMPLGSLTLGKNATALPWWRWFLSICTGQLGLLILTIAAFVAFFGQGPAAIQEPKITMDFIDNVLKNYHWQWGIFPWGVYGLWGLVIAYVTYVKKGNPYLYQIAQGILAKKLEQSLKSYSDSAISGATMMVLSIVAVAIILLLTYAAELQFKIYHLLVPFVTVALLSFIPPLFVFKWGRLFFRRLEKRGLSLNRAYGFIMLLLLIAILLAAYGNIWVIKNKPEFYQLSNCQQCKNYFGHVPAEIRFATLYWAWWILWTPLAGSYLAKISQGRTIREFVVGVYLIPALLLMGSFLWGNSSYETALHLISPLKIINSPMAILICLATISAVIFVKMVKGFKDSSIFVSGFMPVDPNAPVNRIWLKDAAKTVGISKYAPRLLLSCIGILYLHTTLGWFGIQILLASAASLLIFSVYHGLGYWIIRLFKDSAWFGNENIPRY
jgi:choline-glycine betaine transporter